MSKNPIVSNDEGVNHSKLFSFLKLDPDPLRDKQLGKDPQKRNADPQPWSDRVQCCGVLSCFLIVHNFQV